MSLLATLGTARDSLATVSERMQTHSNNIYNANTTGYSRLSADRVVPNTTGALVAVERAADNALLRELSNSQSRLASAEAYQQLVGRLSPTSADPGVEANLVAYIGDLELALTRAATDPQDVVRSQEVFNAASRVSGELNAAAGRVLETRDYIRTEVNAAVQHLQEQLEAFGAVERKLSRAKPDTLDYARAADNLDRIQQNIASLIDVQRIVRPDGSHVLVTGTGAILFDRTPRTIAIANSAAGLSVEVDGVDVTGPDSAMPADAGRIKTLIDFDREVIGAHAVQLDEIARNLIKSFAESGPGATRPPVQGLFVSAIGVSLTNDVYVPGLAGSIAVNPLSSDPANAARLLRDGMLGAQFDVSYSHNTENSAGFSGHLLALVERLGEKSQFAATAGLQTEGSIREFSVSTRGWLNEKLTTSASEGEAASANSAILASLRQSRIGVDLDHEMQIVLELEHSYQATTKLISSVDQMMQTLFQAVN